MHSRSSTSPWQVESRPAHSHPSLRLHFLSQPQPSALGIGLQRITLRTHHHKSMHTRTFTNYKHAPKSRHVYFSSPVSDELRAKISGIKGLVYSYGVGISGQSEIAKDMAYHRSPAQAWADSMVQWEGRNVRSYCVFYFGRVERWKASSWKP